MPRQRTRYNRTRRGIPDDFPQRLVWFKHASGMSWSEIARRLGVPPITIRRWRYKGMRAQLPAYEGAPGTGGQPGPRPPVHRLTTPASGGGLPPQGLLTNKLIGPYDRSRGGRAESEALITG